MFRLLCKYLFLHKRAVLPGIGIFSVVRKPAVHDFANKLFLAPSLHVAFQHDTAALPDDQFYSFVAFEQQIQQPVAANYWSNFATNLQHKLDADSNIVLPEIGTLTVGADRQLLFEPVAQPVVFLPDVAAERGVKQDREALPVTEERNLVVAQNKVLKTEQPFETVQKKEYWWVYAAILALVATAAIIYYYMQNGSLS